ncbi:hypothetical protein GCM10028791_35320 [Echinicola sediminis]
MGKYLTLLRHGETETGQGQLKDFDRNLTAQGVYKLERLANVLRDREVAYDLLLKSPAKRTEETSEIIQAAVKIQHSRAEEDIYLATTEMLMELVAKIDDRFDQVILVGHNPSITAFLACITGDYQVSLSPGMMAVIEIHADSWNIAASRGMGSLLEILQ